MTTRLKSFLSSTVGTKVLIAVTGLGLFVFLILHLIGNTLFFVGPDTFNEYSHALISNPAIYVIEAGLLLVFVLHVFKAVTNWAANRRARPADYQLKKNAGHTSRKGLSSTTMIVSGIVTFVFVVLHLRTFKFGAWYETASGVRDLHRLMVEVFSHPIYVVSYVVCMVLIGMHLRHGVASAFQSLGVSHPRYTPGIVRLGTALALLIGGGFAIIPVLVFLFGGRS
ncbi:MAG: succinate dehydrogenase cytochrome b subunit [Acidobacteria bacterium]|nr:succinate dehydrogenase cytochrome b subunit [Acidobacteriota bacterium]